MAIFGQYTGARVAPLPSGFMGAAMTNAANIQKGLSSMGDSLGQALEQYGKNKDERELLEGDISAIKQIVESDPQRYHDVATNEDNIKKFSEIPDMNLGKLRAYAMNLRTQMGAVDRRAAQELQSLQLEVARNQLSDRQAYSDAVKNAVSPTAPVYEDKVRDVSVIPEGGAELVGQAASKMPFWDKYDPRNIVSEGRDTISPEDVRGFAKGLGKGIAAPVAKALQKFGNAAKDKLIDPAAQMGKSLAVLAQVPGAPDLKGYFQPSEYLDFEGTGDYGLPTPDDAKQLAQYRQKREDQKLMGIDSYTLDETFPHERVTEAPIYIPRTKDAAPGSMLEEGADPKTGLPALVARYAGSTKDLKMPAGHDENKAPIGWWTRLSHEGKMPQDGYTITADGKTSLSGLLGRDDIQRMSTSNRFLELNPHIQSYYGWTDSTGKFIEPSNDVPPAGTKILIPNEEQGIGPETGLPTNISLYRDPNAPPTEEEKAAAVRDQFKALIPKEGSFMERFKGTLENAARHQQAQEDAARTDFTLESPPLLRDEKRTETVQAGERNVTWKEAHAKMIQHLADTGQQITPALSKSLEDYAKTQYAAEDVGITTKGIEGTDAVLVFQDGKFIGQSKKQVPGSTRAIPITVTGPDGEQYRSGKARTPDGEVVDDPFVADPGEDTASINISGVVGTFKGVAKSDKEAQELRSRVTAANEAIPMIDRLLEMAEHDDNEAFGPKRAEADALVTALQGKMRIAVVGPGPMTKEEAERIKKLVANPYEWFRKSSSIKKKLQTTRNMVIDSVEAAAKAQGIERVAGPPTEGSEPAHRNYTNDPRLKSGK